jgi:hypothetical protein
LTCHPLSLILDNVRQDEREAEMNERIEYGEVFTDEHGTSWHQVFEYVNGQCVDAYVSRAGVQL